MGLVGNDNVMLGLLRHLSGTGYLLPRADMHIQLGRWTFFLAIVVTVQPDYFRCSSDPFLLQTHRADAVDLEIGISVLKGLAPNAAH